MKSLSISGMSALCRISLLLWCGNLGNWLWCFNSFLDWGLFCWLGGLSLSGSSSGGLWGSMSMRVSSLLLDVLGEYFIVLGSLFLCLLESVELLSLDQLLSSDSLLSYESLDLWWFVECLVSLLHFSSHDVLSNIVLLSEVEDLSNIVGSLGAESSWLITISDSFDLSVTLLDDSEGDDGKIWATDATSNWLSLSLSSSSGSVSWCLYFKYN